VNAVAQKRWLAYALGLGLLPFRTGAATPLTLTSTSFESGAAIPARHTCEGKDVSPPLSWSGVPDRTKSLVLIVDDPDAPDPKAPKTTWVHWVVYDISASATSLPEGLRTDALPRGSHTGLNDWKRMGWSGPCPPVGRHRYVYKLYALDVVLGDLQSATKNDVEKAMTGHILARAELIGTYEKSGR
jgi:Raf kinase inhibitor-like YbhB/YbcL family protein